MTLADVAVGCALGYLDFRFPQLTWRADHSNLVRLATKLNARQSFIDTAPPAGLNRGARGAAARRSGPRSDATQRSGVDQTISVAAKLVALAIGQ